MALEKFMVKEGYAFFYLNNLGMRVKRVPAGQVVELPDIEHFKQSWKLEPVTPETPAVEDDLDLIEGVKGNKKLAELFEEKAVKTYRQVVELPEEDLAACFKGKAEEKAALAKKLLESAFTLAGLG